VQNSLNEIFFEQYQFANILRTTASDLAAMKFCYESKENCCTVLDTGYSFSHSVPYIKTTKCHEAIIRLDVGGKMLTNYLKDIISYRQLHVLDETFVMNQCKEDCCFVSSNFYSDMKTAAEKGASNNICRDYILPDYLDVRRGYIRSKDETVHGKQVIRMNNERFSVPEILFNPADIGIRQMGVAECIVHSVSKVDHTFHPDLLANVLLIGGNAALPGFKKRTQLEVRKLADCHMSVNVHSPSDPVTYAWQGAKILANSPEFRDKLVSRKDYLENGSEYCNEKFNI